MPAPKHLHEPFVDMFLKAIRSMTVSNPGHPNRYNPEQSSRLIISALTPHEKAVNFSRSEAAL
jgi:hypothetical protein